MMRFKDCLHEGINKQPFSTGNLTSTILASQKDVLGKELSTTKLRNWVKRIIKTTNTDFVTLKVKQDSNLISPLHITAMYLEDWDEADAEEIVELSFELRDKTVFIDPERWKLLVSEIPMLLVHELQHAMQARSRKFEDGRDTRKHFETDEEQYYGDDDEIESYALDISREILLNSGFDKGIKQLKKLQPIKYSDRFNDYLKTFGVHHKVIRKLIKKIIYFMDLYKDKQL